MARGPSMQANAHVQLFTRSAGLPIRWRLLSRNNRELGRGVEEYEGPETCMLAIKELQQSLDEVLPRIRRVNPQAWGWQLVWGDADDVIAVSGRSFDRLIRCEMGANQFVADLRDAVIGPAVMVSDARRWMQ